MRNEIIVLKRFALHNTAFSTSFKLREIVKQNSYSILIGLHIKEAIEYLLNNWINSFRILIESR